MISFKDKSDCVPIRCNCVNKTPTTSCVLVNHLLARRLIFIRFPEIFSIYYFVLISHKMYFSQKVYQFSKVEKKSLENDKGSEPFDKQCKGLPFVAEGSQ
jgi:hypothetical protein